MAGEWFFSPTTLLYFPATRSTLTLVTTPPNSVLFPNCDKPRKRVATIHADSHLWLARAQSFSLRRPQNCYRAQTQVCDPDPSRCGLDPTGYPCLFG